MFKVFISKDSLTDLYCKHADAPTDWLKVILKQRKLYLMNTQDDIDAALSDPDSLLNMYLAANGKSFDFLEQSSITLSNIQSTHSKVLEAPCGCYLLDIDKAEAELIQNNYGVICQSTSDYQECPLVLEEYPISPETGDSGYSWERFSNTCSRIPSNALIINDRNLFTNIQRGNLYGLENVEGILNAFLPKSFDKDTYYHVGIIIGSESGRPNINREYNYNYLVDELSRIKNRLNVPFKNKIIISLLAVSKEDKTIWEKTHNRRIISNYYYVSADYKIAAFCNGESTCSQCISLIPLFCKGMTDGADAPEKHHCNTINDYKYIVENWNAATFKYASGMNENALIDNLQHRLLK